MTLERKLRRAAARTDAARNELVAAVREAREAGLTLRAIADAAGMSHEQVRRLTA